MKAAYLCLILVLVLLCAGYNANATDVGGIIDADTTWTLANSPYIVIGNVLVNQGVTLTIKPGVTVKFDTHPQFGYLYLYIDGTLIARGTESNMITFTSNRENPSMGKWKCIKFRDSAVDATFDIDGNYVSGCILEYCRVEYGGNVSDKEGAVWCDYATPFINHSTITLNAHNGIRIRGSNQSMRISNCDVSDNANHGIYLEQSSGSIISNCIVGGNGVNERNSSGIYLLDSPNSSVNACDVAGNGYSEYSEYGIWLTGSDNSVVSNCNVSDDSIHIEQSSDSNISNCIVSGNHCQIYFIDSPNSSVDNCDVTSSGDDSISLYDSPNSSVTNCNVSEGKHGILFSNSGHSITSNCTVSDNYDKGIYLIDSPDTS